MKTFSQLTGVILALALPGCALNHADEKTSSVKWLPAGLPAMPTNGPALCQGPYLQPAQGKAVLKAALAEFPDRAAWDAYARLLRERIRQGAGLVPWPQRTPLNAVIRQRRVHDGYTVENVAFESVPGYYVTGNLYRPSNAGSSCAVILATHGHWKAVPGGRLSADMQYRCAALARMGAIVFSVDMFGHGESALEVGAEAHAHPFSLTIQTWDNMRALDFLLSLPGADPERVAVTGESGGGTQSFLLTALDSRVKLSVPVVMVSSYFFGGCPCESGLPIHRSESHFANNAMIAALAAPRPMLLVSDGADWTRDTPAIEFPFLKKIYGYYQAAANVANVHLPDEKHDYGPSKREAMYRFVSERFHLNLAAVQKPNEAIDESRITIEAPDSLHVFDQAFPLPANALRSAAAVESALKKLQNALKD